MKLNLPQLTALCALGVSLAPAAEVTLGTAVPPVGDGVENLNFSTDDASNTQHNFVDSDYIGSEYRGGQGQDSDLDMGQSFTTGSNEGGYLLNSVSIRQVAWTSDWDFDGGTVAIRIFDLTGAAGPVWNSTEVASEIAFVDGTSSPIVGGTPTTPQWVTITFDTPVALSPDTLYAWAIGSTGGLTNEEFFMNVDGTATDSYPGGFSLSAPFNSSALWDGNNGQPSDRAFVANMSLPVVPEFGMEPMDYDGEVGDVFTLSSSIIGDPSATFQWEFSPDGFDFMEIDGEVARTLAFNPAEFADNGFYRVVATTTGGILTSFEALVSLVYPDPVITQQPVAAAAALGGAASFTVMADSQAGGTIGYQWFKVDGGGDIELADGGDITGSGEAELVIANVEAADEGEYYVIVSDDAGVGDGEDPTEVMSDVVMLSVAGETASVGIAVPPVGDGVQNLSFSTNDATNTQHNFVPSDYIGSEYRGDSIQMAQSFTTGPDAGYLLNSISVRQVSWGPTDWDYDGGIVTLRVFDLSAGTGGAGLWAGTEVATVLAAIQGSTSPTVGGAPTDPVWLTIGLPETLELSPNTLYAFAVSATGGITNEEFFMNLDGTAVDSYADGFSLTVDATTVLFDGNNGQPSDRAFVANMTSTGPAADFAAWIAGFDVGELDGFDDDADGDGLTNGEENFFGTDPSVSSLGVVEPRKVGDSLIFEHPQNPTPASDVMAAYVWTLDLSVWLADGATSGGTTVNFAAEADTPAIGTTTVTAAISGTIPDEFFAGIEVTQSAP